MSSTNESGFLASVAGELFFERRGPVGAGGTPLVCIHGGPGFTAHYLEPIYALSDKRDVVCYDQAGCGRSKERCKQRRDFSVEGYVAELEELRRRCGFSRMCLLGHSFGGLVAGEYALKYPEHVAGIIFACVSIDIPRWVDDAQRLIGRLPLMQRMVLREGLRTGELFTPQFQAALAEYYRRHVYGLDERPSSLVRAEQEADANSYQVLWGASEPSVTGTLRDYSLSPRLAEITMPTLWMCGRNDEATPEAHEFFCSLTPGGALHIFEQSAHHPQYTEREDFLRVTGDFLEKLD